MFERYTEKARRAIFFSRYEASQFGSPYLETEHLLLGVLREDRPLAMSLSRPPFSLEAVRKWIEERVKVRESIPTSVDLPMSEGSKRVLYFAEEEADGLAHQHIGTEHLVLGLAREESGLAARALREARFDVAAFRAELSRTGEFGTRTAQTKSRSAGNVVEIHGDTWDVRSVRGLAEYYRKFHWERRTWVCRDVLAFRADGGLQLYVGQPYEADKADLIKGGWSEDHCAICWWKLFQSTEPEHGVGHTNGQDWLCNECYQRFISADRSDKL